jgi:hypothetical protein
VLAREKQFATTLPSPDRLHEVALEELREPALAPGQSVSIAQVYWPVGGALDEANSESQLFLSGRWRRLVFGPRPLPAGVSPRLDPGHRPGTYEIAAVCYRDAGRRLLERVRPVHGDASGPAFTPGGTITPLAPGFAAVGRWIANGTDPQLIVRAPGSEAHYVEVWIRWTPVD